MEQAVRREGTGTPSPRRPVQAQCPGAAMLLVLDADLVDAGVQRERLDLRVHVGRRCAPDYQLAVEPDVEAVVAGTMQLDLTRLGHVPEPVPVDAEETPRQRRVIVQEVERDIRADVLKARCAGEADLRIHSAGQAAPLRREAAEDKQAVRSARRPRRRSRWSGDVGGTDRCRMSRPPYYGHPARVAVAKVAREPMRVTVIVPTNNCPGVDTYHPFALRPPPIFGLTDDDEGRRRARRAAKRRT